MHIKFVGTFHYRDSLSVFFVQNSQALCVNGAGVVMKSWVNAGYIPNNVPTSCIDLLNRTYAPDSNRRLTITQIRQHPYLNQALPERRYPCCQVTCSLFAHVHFFFF